MSKADDLLHQILPILHSVKDDKGKLQKILDFLMDEVYEEPAGTVEIPVKYRKIVHDIAQGLDCGFICYLNPDTLEVEEVPQSLADPEEYECTTGEKWDEEFKRNGWDKCITVEPPASHESFRIMEQFLDKVEDARLHDNLVRALNNRRPFANFKFHAETSAYHERWFAFRQQKLEELVLGELQSQLDDDN